MLAIQTFFEEVISEQRSSKGLTRYMTIRSQAEGTNLPYLMTRKKTGRTRIRVIKEESSRE